MYCMSEAWRPVEANTQCPIPHPSHGVRLLGRPCEFVVPGDENVKWTRHAPWEGRQKHLSSIGGTGGWGPCAMCDTAAANN